MMLQMSKYFCSRNQFFVCLSCLIHKFCLSNITLNIWLGDEKLHCHVTGDTSKFSKFQLD